MADWPITNIRGAVEDAIAWLQTALQYATEDPEACEQWKALGATADRIEAVLKAARALLPMHPEIEAAVAEESRAMDEGADRAEALRG